jgi:uncharacterized membrane protein YgaE (UPF0421/DUF939 family)
MLQSAVAAGIAWVIAEHALDVSRPLFAPIAAIISLGFTTGRRGRQAVQVVLGVAVGIAVADLIHGALGSGAAQIGLIVILAMSATLLVSESPGAVVQAGVTGLIVAATPQPHSGISAARLLEAVIGGGVALVFSQLLFPVDPQRRARDAVAELVRGIAATLADTRALLRAERDENVVDSALGVDRRRSELEETIAQAAETMRLTPRHRRRLGLLRRYDDSRRWLDLAVRDLLNVARGADRLDRDAERAAAAEAVGELAAAADALLPDVAAADSAAVLAHVRAAAGVVPPPDELSFSGAFVASALLDLAEDLARAAGLAADDLRLPRRPAGQRPQTMGARQ